MSENPIAVLFYSDVVWAGWGGGVGESTLQNQQWQTLCKQKLRGTLHVGLPI